MTKKLIQKPLNAAIGAAIITSLSGAPLANADSNPFAANQLSSGYMVADMEGKCGGEKKVEKEGKCGEGKCGGEKKVEKEGKCGEGKCGGSMMKEEKSMKEGKCGGEKKSKEGKCGGSM
ncbi:MAG: hypothetical protein KAS48_05965 [Gammaproteobacteria bacterium]|nr:hypothetical protein [Gammaproteobacteria bacterium]